MSDLTPFYGTVVTELVKQLVDQAKKMWISKKLCLVPRKA